MKLFKYISFVMLSGLALSCNDDFLQKSSTDELSTGNYWTSAENAEAAVTAGYQYYGDDWHAPFLSAASDDSYAWSTWPSDVLYVTDGSATTSTGAFEHFWDHYYESIALANNVCDNIDNVDMDTDDRAELKAEARFLRAYSYQHLIALYGDVPLIKHLQTDPSDYYVSRTSKDSIVDYLVTEIDDFADDLPTVADEFGHATKGAALTLKARILLYDGQWVAAAEAAKEVMDLGVYSLDADFESLFDGSNEESSEIIFSAQYTSDFKNSLITWTGAPTLGGWGEIVPLQSLIDAFECTDGNTIEESSLYDKENPFVNRDPRLAMSIILPGTEISYLSEGTTQVDVTIDVTAENSSDGLGASNASYSGYYYKKYVPTTIYGSYDASCENDIILMRYPEVLLTYAEAKIEAGTIDQSVLTAINTVRERANMPDVTTTDQSELRTIVRRERRVEFAGEEQRLFDIKRWGIDNEVLNGTIYGIYNNFDDSRDDYGENVVVGTRSFTEGRDELWPIPQSEIDNNENLTQNPNWD